MKKKIIKEISVVGQQVLVNHRYVLKFEKSSIYEGANGDVPHIYFRR